MKDDGRVWAGWRDASFLPSHGRAEVYHVAVVSSGWANEVAGCRPGHGESIRADTSRGVIALDAVSLCPANEIPERARCRRRGCRERWPAPRAREANI